MSGFSLGAGHRQGGAGGDEQEAIPPDNLFLYGGSGAGGGGGSNRNEEISYTRGFELWQQHQHQQQQIQRHLYPASGGMLAFSDEAQLGGSGRSGGSAGRGSSSGGAGSVSCQDCGNQAKKDCAHLRCRTCCKSRNFQCPTHVKSTWVPASKRRERAAAAATAAAQQQQQQQTNRGAAPPGSSEPSKRPREICTRFPSTIVATSSGVGGSGMEGALSFPAEVSSPAVFRCVRVSPMDESEDEYAYQTAVSIGGHVFKGILYDQGRESNYPPSPPRSSSAAAAVAIAMGPSSSAAPATAGLLDPSSLYPAPISAFMAGTQFFPHHPRP